MRRTSRRRDGDVGPAGLAVVVLSVVLGLAVASGAVARDHSATSDYETFMVSALSSTWLDTGLVIPKGASLSFDYASDATCHAPTGPNCDVGKSAGLTCSSAGVAPGPAGNAVPYGEFAARIGLHGKPFKLPGTGTGPGRLYLVYNDCAPPAGYSDNDGAGNVIVYGDLGRHKPKVPRGPIAKPQHVRYGQVVGQVIEITGKQQAFVTRSGKTTELQAHDAIRAGDIITTGSSALYFDFSGGGRTGIAPGTEVTVGERSVEADGRTTLRTELKVAGSIGQLKEPLEIQLQGHNTGVKG